MCTLEQTINRIVTSDKGLALRRRRRHCRPGTCSHAEVPMLRSCSVPTLLAFPLLLSGCATRRPFDRSTEPGGKPLPPTTAGAVIITGQALSADPGRTVLDAIKRAMPQLRVSDWSRNHCPTVQLRGKDSVTGSSDPDVY